MTAPLREQHSNNARSTLDGAINNSTISIVVADGSVFPSTGNFRVMVESEIMKCTARSSNTLTVERGQEGTSAASHADDQPIELIYTAAGITRLFQDSDALFGYSGVLPQGRLLADDGKAVLAGSDFTWQNQGGASIADEDGTLLLSCPTDSGQNVRVLERSAPSTPYTYIGAFTAWCPSMDADAKPFFGMGFRESSTSKLMLMGFIVESFFNNNPNVAVRRMTDTSTLLTTTDGPKACMIKGHLKWIKIENDGTNTKWYVSADGVSWLLYFSENKTTFFSGNPDKVLWWGGNFVNSGGDAVPLNVRLHHWSKGE